MKWTKEEENILLRHYQKMPPLQLQEMLPNRSLDSINKKCRTLGLSKAQPHRRGVFWTAEEMDIMRQYYPSEGADGIMRRLPHRTVSSIHNMACQSCIPRSGQSKWTANEMQILKSRYGRGGSAGVQALLPRHSGRAIRDKASRIGLNLAEGVRKKWTHQDIEKLRVRYAAGDSLTRLSYLLECTEQAIRSKVRYMRFSRDC